MVPIIPLDGAIILKSILNKIFSFKTSYKLYVVISIINIIIYVGFNYKYSLNNYLIIGIFIYKIINSIKEYKYIYNRFLLERYLKKYKFKYLNTKVGTLDILKGLTKVDIFGKINMFLSNFLKNRTEKVIKLYSYLHGATSKKYKEV